MISIFLGWQSRFNSDVYAADTCNGSVTPGIVSANSQTAMTINVTNTGDFTGQYVMVKRPSENFSLYNVGIEGWTVGAGTAELEVWGGSVPVGETFSFQIGANIGLNEAASADWWVGLSFGGPYIQCAGGPYGAEISGSTDTLSPQQSEPTITELSDSSVTIGWTTDEPSTSDLYYGPAFESTNTQSYNQDLVTSHGVTISGLEANKTYYFKYRSIDASGNASNYKDFYSFSTPSYSESEAVVQTVTKTVTVLATPPPAVVKTQTIFVRDTTAPSVAITTELSGVYERAPTFRGVAQDGKGVYRVDYSTDGGRNWLPVDEMSETQAQKISFSFTPLGLLDGNYAIKVRATDTSNNAGFSPVQTLVIDRLPPRVGAVLLSIGSQALEQSASGLVIGLQGVSIKINLSEVGGATQIDVVSTEVSGMRVRLDRGNLGILGMSQQVSTLSKNTETGLWSGMLNFAQPGLYTLTAKAVDGANNETERELQTIFVLPNGTVSDEEGIVGGLYQK